MGRRKRVVFLALSCCLVLCVVAAGAQNATAVANETDTDPGWPSDPILQYRPPFPLSLPVQILLNGIVVTLAAVLFMQLLFTAQYHWPLAPVNFVLQVSAVVTLLVTSIVTLHIVFATASQESRQWPYMLNYVAVDIPPSPRTDWPTADLAAWLLMTATTSGLIQITHIQFLTLLFPSRLERRLIYVLLAPLAFTSAAMQLSRIHARGHVLSAVSGVQNVCNAALSLLFTASLFLWGLLVNRKNAWRTDGGTAAFGIGALTLAPMSSAIALVYVRTKEEYTWMPSLMWAIILWQSFLGWWWWVGAGTGVGEVDELLLREEKRKNKRTLRSAQRRRHRERAESLWKSVTDALSFGSGASPDASPTVRAPARRPSLSTIASSGGGAFRRLVNQSYGLVLQWRHDHLQATREQAVERVERINQVYGHEPENVGEPFGWGLGSFGLRRDMKRERELHDDETIVGSESEGDAESLSDKGAEGGGDGRRRVGRNGSGTSLHAESSATGAVRRAKGKGRATSIDQPEAGAARGAEGTGRATSVDQPAAVHRPPDRPASTFWWWGPLRRWRLQDSTTY